MSSLDEALALKRAGNLDAAVIALEGVLSDAPSNVAALTQLAEVQSRRGQFREATAALSQAERTAGVSANTARVRGDLLYREQRWDEAARAYGEADALGDRGTWSLVRQASCRMKLGDAGGARGAASRAVERDPASAPGWVILGDLALEEGNAAEAEAMYQRAHERSPGDGWAYARLVKARLLQLSAERRSKEIAVLRKTAGRDNPHLLGVLADLQRHDGNDEAAAATWEERARRTGEPYARKMYGYALRRANRLDEAAGVLGSCLVEEPDDLILFRTYIGLQKQRGALEELRATLVTALPRAQQRRGAFHGELRKLPPPGPGPT